MSCNLPEKAESVSIQLCSPTNRDFEDLPAWNATAYEFPFNCVPQQIGTRDADLSSVDLIGGFHSTVFPNK